MLKHLSHLRLSYCLIAFLSSAFQSFGMYNIHAISGVTEGGILGLTLLLQNWFGISPAVSGFIITAACFLLGRYPFGKSFIAYSIIASSGFSLGYAVCEIFPRSGRSLPICPLPPPSQVPCLSASVQALPSGWEPPPAAMTPWP